MEDAMTLKKTELADVREINATQEEITVLEGQIASLKYSCGWWRDVVAWATLPGQHQMIEGDLWAGLEILDLVQIDLWCLLTVMKEDTSQMGTVTMIMVQQLVKVLHDNYVKVKGNLHLLQHQASDGRPQEKTHQQ